MADTSLFEKQVSAGNSDEAIRWLNSAEIDDGLTACMNVIINEKKLDSINALLQTRSLNNSSKACFCLVFAKIGQMPQTMYALSDSDYDAARTHYLKLLDKEQRIKKLIPLWTGNKLADVKSFRQTNAKKVPFYPELVNRYNNRRTRVCEIAKSHINIGPNHPRQVNLFSLGGRYGYANASAGTKPTSPGTTCMLTARGIWHAAGLNVTDKALSTCVINGSLGKELDDMKCYVKVPKNTKASLKMGDIFQIDEPAQERRDTSGNVIAAAHVGLYIGDGTSLLWDVVQGGAPNHVTVRRTYQLNNELRFTDDLYSWGARRLIGYWDLDQAWNYWMESEILSSRI